MAQPHRRAPREFAVMAALCASVLANALAFGTILPLLPVIGENVGAGPLELGVLYAMYPIALLVTVTPLGVLSDMRGRRRVILLGTGLLVVTSLGFALSTHYIEFLLFRLLQGISDAAVWVSVMPLLAEVGDPATLGYRSGWVMAFFGVGVIVGPLLGGTGSPLVAYGVVSAFCFAAFVYAWYVTRRLREPRRKTPDVLRTIWGLLANPRVLVAGLATLIYGYVFGVVEPTLPPLFYGLLSVAAIGVYVGVLHVVFAFTQPAIGRLADRIGEVPLIYSSVLTLAVMMPLVVVAAHPLFWLASMPVIGLALAAANTTSISLLNRGVTDAQRGIASSLYNILFAVGSLTGPIVAGAMVEGIGYLAGMLSISAIGVLMLAVMWNRNRELKKG